MFQADHFQALLDPHVCDVCRHIGADVFLKIDVRSPYDHPVYDWRPTEFFVHQACLSRLLLEARHEGAERAKNERADAERMARERAEWMALKAEAEARMAAHEARFEATRKLVAQLGLPLWDKGDNGSHDQ